ncbi:MAG: hypothetical protein AB1486_15915 [Planctomycetota bacterium]
MPSLRLAILFGTLLGPAGCALLPPAGEPADLAIEHQEVRLLHDPSGGRLGVFTRLSARNDSATSLDVARLAFSPALPVSLTAVRDAQGRSLEAIDSGRGILTIPLVEVVPPRGRVTLRLEYTLDASARQLPVPSTASSWLAIEEQDRLLPRSIAVPSRPSSRVEGEASQAGGFTYEVTCRPAPGQFGVIAGEYAPGDDLEYPVSRFRTREPRAGLAGVFGPLRPVATGPRDNPVWLWVGPEISASRCQQVGQLVAAIDGGMRDEMGGTASAEPVALVEHPGQRLFSSERTLFVPARELAAGDESTQAQFAFEVACALVRARLPSSRFAPHLSPEDQSGLIAFLGLHVLEAARENDIAGLILGRLAARFLTEATAVQPLTGRGESFAAVLHAADRVLEGPERSSPVMDTVRYLLANDRFSWEALEESVREESRARNLEAIADWVERPVVPLVRYSWTTSIEARGTRTVLFARATPALPLRFLARFWSPRDTLDRDLLFDGTSPDMEVPMSFLPHWIELDPLGTLPVILEPEAAPGGNSEQGKRLLERSLEFHGLGPLAGVEQVVIGDEDRLVWTEGRGLWARPRGQPERCIAPHGLSLLTRALEGELEVRSLPVRRVGGARYLELEILESNRPCARLGIDPDTGEMRSVVLADARGHCLASLAFEDSTETGGFCLPSRVSLDAPPLDATLRIQARPSVVRRAP